MILFTAALLLATPPRHEMDLAAVGGLAITSGDHYDSSIDGITVVELRGGYS